jgi:hypothetical protein
MFAIEAEHIFDELVKFFDTHGLGEYWTEMPFTTVVINSFEFSTRILDRLNLFHAAHERRATSRRYIRILGTGSGEEASAPSYRQSIA